MDYLQYFSLQVLHGLPYEVLNLIINGLPSILYYKITLGGNIMEVLNLIINGLPSIQ